MLGVSLFDSGIWTWVLFLCGDELDPDWSIVWVYLGLNIPEFSPNTLMLPSNLRLILTLRWLASCVGFCADSPAACLAPHSRHLLQEHACAGVKKLSSTGVCVQAHIRHPLYLVFWDRVPYQTQLTNGGYSPADTPISPLPKFPAALASHCPDKFMYTDLLN